MKDKINDFLSLLDLEEIVYIITDDSGNEISRSPIQSDVLKNKDKAYFTSVLKEGDDDKNTIYRDDVSVFKYNDLNCYIFIENKSISGGLANYLIIFNNLINTISESVIVSDSTFHILFYNHIFLNTYNYSESEISEIMLTELFPPEYLETVIDAVKKNDTVDINAEIYDGMGEALPVRMTLIKWGKKQLIIIEDKQEKESYSREIEGLKQMQKLVFDSIGQGIVVLDKKANLIQYNKFMTQEYKFSRELIGKNIFEIVPDLKTLNLDQMFVDIMEKKRVKKLMGIKRHSRRLGRELYQNFVGYPLIENEKAIGVVVVIEDITEKKRLEDEFETSKKRTQVIAKLNAILTNSLELNYVLESISSYIAEYINSEIVYAYNVYAKHFTKYSFSRKGASEGEYIDDSALLKDMLDSAGIDDPVIVSDRKMIKAFFKSGKVKEMAIIPVKYNKRILGIFIAESKKLLDSEHIRSFVTDIAQYSRYILDKSVLFEEKRSNLLKLELTLKISRLITQSREYSKTFQSLLNIISEEIDADDSIMLIRDLDYKSFVITASRGKRADKFASSKKYFNINEMPLKSLTDEPLYISDTGKSKDMPNICRIFGSKSGSIICVPVKYKNDTLGIFVFAKKKKSTFSRAQFDIIRVIATSSSSYIKNMHLQMQMEDKIEQLSILYKMSTSIRPVINYSFLKKAIVSSLGNVSKASAVMLFRERGGQLEIDSEFYQQMTDKNRILKEKRIRKNLIRKFPDESVFELTNKNKVVRDYFNDIDYIKAITVRNSHEKVLILLAYREEPSSHITEETFLAIINEMSISLENAILFGKNEKRLKQFSSISAITKKLAQLNIRNLDEYYQYIVDAAKELLNTEYASLLLVENRRLEFKAIAGIPIEDIKGYFIKPGDGIAGHVLRTGKHMIVNDTSKSRYFKKLDLSNIYEVRNLVNIPLVYKGTVIGVLCADNKKDGDFSENDVNLMKILANSTIIAFEHFMDIELGKKLSDIILDNIPSGIIYINSKGLIQQVNSGFTRISRFSQTDVFNMPYGDVFVDEGGIIQESLVNKEAVLREEITLKKKNAELIPCGISISPVKWDNGSDLVCIIQDLSEIKRMRHELKEKENLALLGQMAAGMAHEIKNPLAGILTGLEFLHMQINTENDIQRQSIELVIKEVKRLDRLVNDMTSFAKSKIKILSDMDVKGIIDRALELTRDKFAKKQINISTHYAEGIKPIEADEEQILEVLINLVLNANQAIESDGEIKISVKQNNENTQISVSNNGPPIPQDIMEKIFTPFFTTKSGGTGLGLSISYNIIKEHGGKLQVNNEDTGVVFHITLPNKSGDEDD